MWHERSLASTLTDKVIAHAFLTKTPDSQGVVKVVAQVGKSLHGMCVNRATTFGYYHNNVLQKSIRILLKLAANLFHNTAGTFSNFFKLFWRKH